jgi:hypothetical protein
MGEKKSGGWPPKDEIVKGSAPHPTRFKPGQSGNPKGRPKDAKGAESMARAELKRKVTATQNGVRRKMTVEQVAYRRLADKAIAGDLKALILLLTLAKSLNPSDPGSSEVAVPAEQDLAIIREYLARKRFQEGGNQ